ncbi:hypothetical protein F4677DRAFT_445643 [Hypoxylon crocopeplum]|nr:hypothetical protein F4677DRAFT_445643 [Hypoxylon crocopeplum]
MRNTRTLRLGLELLGGLTFESDSQLSEDLNEVLLTLLPTRETEVTPEEAQKAINSQVSLLFLFCKKNEDMYRRVREDKAFYYLIMLEWNLDNPAAPYSPNSIEELVALFISARRRYLAGSPSKEVKIKLTFTIDRFIEVVDTVGSSVVTRNVPGLAAPKGSSTWLVWPPGHFGAYNAAILGEETTRQELFGIKHDAKGGEDQAPNYPHDQNLPLVVRKYLCWLSLTETKPTSKIALFLAPVAFIDHEKRQEWYMPTGKESRFYATVDDFLEYAKDEFEKTGKAAKDHVISLLTPWFFEVDEAAAKAKKKNKAVPNAWKELCFRAGMMIGLTRLKRVSVRQGYRVIIFKPGLPHYKAAAEPFNRRAKQDAWMEKLLDKVDNTFLVEEGWMGGVALDHVTAPQGRGVLADSVESSSEIITEIMEVPSTLPTTKARFLERGFQAMGRYEK